MKHYVVVLDWATESDSDVHILGVAHTLNDAKEIFNRHVEEEKQIAEENGYDIDEDNAMMFDAGEMGYWRDNHITLYIEEVE